MLEGMPDGVLGFRAIGKLTAEDYSDGMMPALREAAEPGEMRAVYVLGECFDGLDAGATVQHVKAGFELTIGHRSSWKRLAMETDLDWIRHSVHLFGWLAPRKPRLVALDRPARAR